MALDHSLWNMIYKLFLLVVNYTTCQLQKIEAALMRRGFSPACNPDGSFREIQCTTTTPLKCWRVNAQGEKFQETDVTIKFSSNSKRHQPQAWKRKPRNVRQYPNLEEDEMGNLFILFRWCFSFDFSFTINNFSGEKTNFTKMGRSRIGDSNISFHGEPPHYNLLHGIELASGFSSRKVRLFLKEHCLIDPD